MNIKDDYATKEIRKRIDWNHNIVMERISVHPEGIGLNDLAGRVTDLMSKTTLRKKLNELILWGFVSQNPKEPRRGQKIYYYSTQVYEEYFSMLERIKSEAESLKKIFHKININDENGIIIFDYLVNYLYEEFSIFSILDSISSWNERLIYNVGIMTSIFLHIYVHIMKVREEILNILEDNKHQVTIHKHIDVEKKKLEKILRNNPELKQLMEITEQNIFNINNKRNTSFTILKISSEP